MLTVAAGCDKAKALVSLGRAEEPDGPPPEARLDLSRRPDVLFQLFGERDDPRMVPVAAIVDGVLKPIELTASGWRQFDAMYTRSPKMYALYRDGVPIGSVRVRRGMWERPGEPLYTLPGCRTLTPLAAVTLETSARIDYTVEGMATTAGVSVAARPAAKPVKSLDQRARGITLDVARAAGIDSSRLSPSAFRALAITTGTSASPTIVAWSLDPESSDRDGFTAHVMVLADDIEGEYQPTYRHTASGPAMAAEYRRYVDHLDLNGDGIDEVVLEAWPYGGETYLTILGYAAGEWREVFRGRQSWCLAKPRPR